MLDELERDPLALTEEEKFTLLAVLAVLMILVLYFEFRIMRGKAKSVRKINARKDETYNAILTCNSVINILERQGSDVSDARAMVAKAKSLMHRGEHEDAIELCEKAREEMTKMRTQAKTPVRRTRVEKDSLESIADEIVSEPRTMSREDSYRGAKLEVQGGPNYLVAKFEINTAKEEIAAATASGQDASEASATLRKAQTEFDSGNYAKALSLAVKAKKAASPQGADEAIPLKRVQKAERPSEEIDGEAEDVVDVCSNCGSEIDSEDMFCGSCGTKRAKERFCPSCGRAASEDDRFCRKCGSKVP
ncbi:MAG TPA: zinc ribbon domain-containing protein [Thermoplasmata archaeon]|nr:zinc ribbon domain-containing protein [Thermoplasmata archaeon]